MATSRKKELQKLGQVKLTEDQRTLLAANVDTPFFKLITDVILPSRVNQIALTCVSVAQDEQSLWLYKGMVNEAEWLQKYINNQIGRVDDAKYSNEDDGELTAEDDNPNS